MNAGDLLDQIVSICTTLTNEAMDLAKQKAKQSGFDVDRALVPLDESFINLSSARAILEDAIEKRKLTELPITVQKEISANLEGIAKSLQGLAGGVDEVVNLTNGIEALNTAIWKYGFHNLSEEVLGYQRKLNQLKTQEVRISKLVSDLAEATSSSDRARAASDAAEKESEGARLALENAQKNAASCAVLLDQIKLSADQISAVYSTIKQQEKQSGELSANIKTANNELLSLDTSIKGFYGDVDEYRKKITQTTDDASKLITNSDAAVKKLIEESVSKIDAAYASLQEEAQTVARELTAKIDTSVKLNNDKTEALLTDTVTDLSAFQKAADTRLTSILDNFTIESQKLTSRTDERVQAAEVRLDARSAETIEANQQRTANLLSELEKLKDQVREQIQQATGFTLFGAFQARQNEVVKSKKWWAIAIFALVFVSAGVTFWIAHEAQSYSATNLAFWVKLSLTIPLAFAITFCTVQYGRERRLEEEYAFKASISVSLNPYRELIRSILEKDGTVDLAKYTEFVIDSVKNVFTPPTDKVFEGEKKPSFTAKTFEQTAKIIGAAVKAAK
ncbi:MAG TPA: hypothetical protein VGK48_20795 [Terriglobia bacterium]|jgi:hypothetical protein